MKAPVHSISLFLSVRTLPRLERQEEGQRDRERVCVCVRAGKYCRREHPTGPSGIDPGRAFRQDSERCCLCGVCMH